MRATAFVILAGLSALGLGGTAFAAEPGYITSVVAGTPDPNSKVPAFNAVPGAGTGNFSEATPQAILNEGSRYVICITMQNANVSATSTWTYKITQLIGGAKTVVQHATVAKNVALSGNGLYVYCMTSAPLPTVTGSATLSASIAYATAPKASIVLNVPILLN